MVTNALTEVPPYPCCARAFLRRLPCSLAIVLALSAISSSAFAQEESRSAVPQREQAERQLTEEAAERARAQSGLLEQPVTYNDILADPDNFDLNVRYVKTQLARGDYLGASATLERLLLLRPELPDVRSLQGLVLLRLGSLDEAERTLRSINEASLPSSLRRQRADALREIHARRRRTQWTLHTTTGWQYDRNRNAAPSDFRMVSDVATGLEGTARRRPDTSLLLVQSLEMVHDLGMQAGHQLTASLTHYLGEQTRVDDLDLESFSVSAGGVLKTWLASITPELLVSHTTLSRETYFRSQGGHIELSHAIGSSAEVAVDTTVVREDFSGINENTTAAERRGMRSTVKGSASWLFTPSMQLQADVAYDNKTAKADYYAYDGLTVEGSHTWIFPRGHFLINALSLESDYYDEPDVAIASNHRRDLIFRYRLTYGMPLAVPLPERWTPPDWIGRDWHVVLGFEQLRALSSITNYSYTNSKWQVMLNKKFSF